MNHTGLQQGPRCVCNTIHIPMLIREINIVSRKLELEHNALIVCLGILKNIRKIRESSEEGSARGDSIALTATCRRT
jgi:hypothetical protein